jgi:hypothetical protein
VPWIGLAHPWGYMTRTANPPYRRLRLHHRRRPRDMDYRYRRLGRHCYGCTPIAHIERAADRCLVSERSDSVHQALRVNTWCRWPCLAIQEVRGLVVTRGCHLCHRLRGGGHLASGRFVRCLEPRRFRWVRPGSDLRSAGFRRSRRRRNRRSGRR